MSQTSISVEHVSKRFRLVTSTSLRYKTLRDAIAGVFQPRVETPDAGVLWALRDINFEVSEGEAIGLIGHNGAGKSTLLKILSRITEPTEGRAVLRGRVGSLLEVGTGFHPELTGRENIFLNGAILGMTRAEIKRDFDAIVAFAGVDRFLETPVKRFSSGMFVRLAFAVAAHLTPEILLVDEVLAVGDLEFQRKCLGRMNEVARSGRTVVFVSHNLDSIERLCSKAILLRKGEVALFGDTRDVIAGYMSNRQGSASWDVAGLAERDGTGRSRILRLSLWNRDASEAMDVVPVGTSFRIRVEYEVHEATVGAMFGISILSDQDQRLAVTSNFETGDDISMLSGTGFVDCIVERPNLLPGTYYLEVWVTDPRNRKTGYADHLRMVGQFEVIVDTSQEGRLSGLTAPDRGHMLLEAHWEGAAIDATAGHLKV